VSCPYLERVRIVLCRAVGKEIQHIFHPFRRGSNALHEPAIRLGLSLVKEVVDLQGGKILMQSGPQKGSTFSIVLPLSKNGRRKGGEMAAENFTNN
jgi:K+-sensing histidine kinase KdpD